MDNLKFIKIYFKGFIQNIIIQDNCSFEKLELSRKEIKKIESSNSVKYTMNV